MKTNTSSSAPQSTISISIHGKTLILFFLFPVLPIFSSIPNKPLSTLPLRIPTPRTPNISTRQRTRLVQIHFRLHLLLLFLLRMIPTLFSSKTTPQRNSFSLHTLPIKFSPILLLVVVMFRTRRGKRRRIRQRKTHPSNPFARNNFHISN